MLSYTTCHSIHVSHKVLQIGFKMSIENSLIFSNSATMIHFHAKQKL